MNKCPSCGACKECGAKPTPNPYQMWPYVQPYTMPYTQPGLPWKHNQISAGPNNFQSFN